MTAKELKQQLEGVPDHMDVFIEQSDSEFRISLVQSASVIEATFIGEKEEPKDNVFLLSDQ